MLTLKDVLTDKVDLDLECVDRVYLNGYVKNLQMPGGLINFIREQMGFPIPSPMLLAPVSEAFRANVEKFAAEQGLTIVNFAHGEEKDETARAHLAKFGKRSGVVLIGKAQEKTSGYTARRKDQRFSIVRRPGRFTKDLSPIERREDPGPFRPVGRTTSLAAEGRTARGGLSTPVKHLADGSQPDAGVS
jgi:hypothetical protein